MTTQYFQQGPSGAITQTTAPSSQTPTPAKKRNLVQVYVGILHNFLQEIAKTIKTPQQPIVELSKVLESLKETHGDNLRIYHAAPLIAAMGGIFMLTKMPEDESKAQAGRGGPAAVGIHTIQALTATTDDAKFAISNAALQHLAGMLSVIRSSDPAVVVGINKLVSDSIAQIDERLRKYALPGEVLGYLSMILGAVNEVARRWSKYQAKTRLQLMFWFNLCALTTRVAVKSGADIENSQALIQMADGIMRSKASEFKGRADAFGLNDFMLMAGQMGLGGGGAQMMESQKMFLLILSDPAVTPLQKTYFAGIRPPTSAGPGSAAGAGSAPAAAAPPAAIPSGLMSMFGGFGGAAGGAGVGGVGVTGPSPSADDPMMAFFSKLQDGSLGMEELVKMSPVGADQAELAKQIDPKDFADFMSGLKSKSAGASPMDVLQMLVKEELEETKKAEEAASPTTTKAAPAVAPAPPPSYTETEREKKRLEALESQMSTLQSTLEAIAKGQLSIQGMVAETVKKQDRIDSLLLDSEKKREALMSKVAQLEKAPPAKTETVKAAEPKKTVDFPAVKATTNAPADTATPPFTFAFAQTTTQPDAAVTVDFSKKTQAAGSAFAAAYDARAKKDESPVKAASAATTTSDAPKDNAPPAAFSFTASFERNTAGKEQEEDLNFSFE